MKRVIIYTDGACRGNPDGPGGYGAVILYTDNTGKTHTKELSAGYDSTTNNRMEMMAVISSLECLKYPCEVELHSDSRYIIDSMTKGWIYNWIKKGWKTSSGDPVKNRALWERMLLAAGPHKIEWHWVKGHAGEPLNEKCDYLATSAADSDPSGLLHDDGGDLK